MEVMELKRADTKQVDVRGTFRILHRTPGHITLGFWINGGKAGDLTIRVEEEAGLFYMLSKGGFKYVVGSVIQDTQ